MSEPSLHRTYPTTAAEITGISRTWLLFVERRGRRYYLASSPSFAEIEAITTVYKRAFPLPSYLVTDRAGSMAFHGGPKEFVDAMAAERVRDLSPHALDVLSRIARDPMPTMDVNPGVSDKLIRDGYAEIVSLPSPFQTHRGKRIPHLKATEKGVAKSQPVV